MLVLSLLVFGMGVVVVGGGGGGGGGGGDVELLLPLLLLLLLLSELVLRWLLLVVALVLRASMTLWCILFRILFSAEHRLTSPRTTERQPDSVPKAAYCLY